jgi:signal peptidase II
MTVEKHQQEVLECNQKSVKPDYLRVTPFFNLTLAYNTGAAFSFLDSAPGWQIWFFGVIALVVSATLLIWLKRLPRQQWWLSIALACIIGGALGNLWDRVSYGHVIDFIQLHAYSFYWPVFNIADSAICLGAMMLVLEALFKRK